MTRVCKECNVEKAIAEFSNMNNIQVVTWKENNEKGLSMYCPNRNMEER